MSTDRARATEILEMLGHPGRFRVRAMFGEFALYADDQVAALICDGVLYVKDLPESALLTGRYPMGVPYEGAKYHYAVDELSAGDAQTLAEVLLAIGAARSALKRLR
jgi:TfoX/Sxy family transcriptional regulator of competence genes